MQGTSEQTVMRRSRRSYLAPITRCLLVIALLTMPACSGLGQDEEPRWDTDIPPSEDFNAVYGAWSPDGKEIAFVHSDCLGSPCTNPATAINLWIANLETGERRKILPGRVISIDWSPDGGQLMFHSKTDPEFLYKIDTDGSNLTRLTGPGSPNPDLEYTTHGRWSPSGDRILFTVVAGEPRGKATMKADGSAAQILVPYGISGSWFPDGDRFAYANWDTTQAPQTSVEIYTASANGSNVRKLTDLPHSDLVGNVAVSPDGQQIAFSHRGRDGRQELYLMRADGTNVRQVTEGTGIPTQLAWHPDGKKIMFGRFIPNVSERLYFLDVKTLEVTPVFPK